MFGTKKRKRRKSYLAKVNRSSGIAIVKTYFHNKQAKHQQEKRRMGSPNFSSPINKSDEKDSIFDASRLLEKRNRFELDYSNSIDKHIWGVMGLIQPGINLSKKSSLFYQMIAEKVRRKHGIIPRTDLIKRHSKYYLKLARGEGLGLQNAFTERSIASLDSWSENKGFDDYKFKYLYSNICNWRLEQYQYNKNSDLRELPNKEDCFLSDMLDFTSSPSLSNYNIMIDKMKEYSLTIKYTLVLSSIEDS